MASHILKVISDRIIFTITEQFVRQVSYIIGFVTVVIN